ncbi:hypothetical protein K1719_014654 [Acacia pycnantha]|nr:hypothetical protein K1719_014654 [Acacia pycnantha]
MNHMLTSTPSSAKSHSRRPSFFHQRSKSLSYDELPSTFSQRSVSSKIYRQLQLPVGQREVMINDIVGNGISGILYKWVNYGRGWQRRWFVLLDGVLSYYKINGPRMVLLSREVETGSLYIGLDSLSGTYKHRGRSSRHYKPIEEIHLMVCSIQERKSDERRFDIYTGTKRRFQLRAETREDKEAWVEALLAAKDMFPRLSNAEIMAPAGFSVISTEKLRQRLLEEGISEAVIQDSEHIMRDQLSELYQEIVVLKNKQMQLVDALRNLETDKVDLENTFVRESRGQSKEDEDSIRSVYDKYSEGSVSDFFDELDWNDDSDDDYDAFFDSSDTLSPICDKNNRSELDRSPLDSGEEGTPNNEYRANLSIGSVGSYYPHVNRRKNLPDPVEKEKRLSLWSLLKDNIGKDLTKICLPVYFNEPLSSLQKCFEDLEYSYLLDQAYLWGKMGNNLVRTLHVAAFAVSSYASTEDRTYKPFTPLLGETYEADYPDKGIRFISEKVSHHPMVMACHCEGSGWKFWGDVNIKSKFSGRSIQIDPVGLLTLEFDDGQVFRWSKVTTSVYNLILGKLYCDHYGTMSIDANQEYSCRIKFKEPSIINRNPHQVHGQVADKKGRTVATLRGKWDESLHYVIGDNSRKGKGSAVSSKPRLLWKRSEPPEHPTKYNLTQFGLTLNEITPELREKLPPTDSRLRPDQRYLENGLYEMANAEKLRLEQKQRQALTMQNKGWQPRWFKKAKGSNTYRYVGGYWEAREQGNWESCSRIFE